MLRRYRSSKSCIHAAAERDAQRVHVVLDLEQVAAGGAAVDDLAEVELPGQPLMHWNHAL